MYHFIIICVLLIQQTHTEYQEQTINTGLIFTDLGRVHTSYTKWHICYYYDLNPYFNQIQQLEHCIEKMTTICGTLQENELCITTIEQLKSHMEDMKTDNTKIESFKQRQERKKRAPFELIGKIQNILYGIMDADSAREYDKKINELQQENNITNQLMQEQTTIVKNTIKLNQNIFNEFRTKINNLTQNIIAATQISQSSLLDATQRINFHGLAQMAMSIIFQHNKISEELMKLLENSLQGKITNTIPLSELKSNLKQIKYSLKENQKLAIDLENESIYHVFKTATLRANMINKRILIEINIPILETDAYKLIKAIPIPITIQKTTVIMKPTSEYFLFNSEKSHYIPLQNDELNNCKHNTNDELICTPYAPIHYDRNDICELELLLTINPHRIFENCNYGIIPTTNYLIQINKQDRYYCFITKPMVISIKCYGKEIDIQKITKNGILKIEKDCVITTENLKLKSHNVKYFNNTKMIEPKYVIDKSRWSKIEKNLEIDNNINIEFNKTTTLIQDYNEDYEKLLQETSGILEKEKDRKILEEIHYDKIREIGSTSTMSIVIIIIIIVIVYLIFKKLIPVGNTVDSLYTIMTEIITNITKITHQQTIEQNSDHNSD